MKIKTKITLFAATLALAFLWSGNAKADYWTKYTRESSGNVLPQYFELTTMAKSSSGVKFLYGVNRIGGTENESNWERNLVSFDGSNWTDHTASVKSVGGYNDLEFFSMYADQKENVWMPNRKDPNTPLLKYNGTTGQWEKITAETIAQQSWPSGPPTRMLVKNLFSHPNNTDLMYAIANGDDRLYLLIYDFTQDKWSDSGITGGPLDSENNSKDIWGFMNPQDDSIWIYEYHSSEYEFTGQGDQGIGIWRYKNNNWTQYNSEDQTSDGVALKNGITEAFCDSSGNVWVGTRHGVFKYDYTSGNWSNWTKDNSNIFTNRVIKIQQDSDGRIWIIALEDENVPEDRGGISIYNASANEWDYYTSYNGEDVLDDATNIFMIGGDEVWMFAGHGEEAMRSGIYQLIRDDSHTALYGQISGTPVEKATLDPLKKAKSKKVTIWKKYRVQKKNKRYKWKKTRVYSGRTSTGWYKKLNLDAGTNIKYIISIQGRKKRVINASTGDPIRLDFN